MSNEVMRKEVQEAIDAGERALYSLQAAQDLSLIHIYHRGPEHQPGSAGNRIFRVRHQKYHRLHRKPGMSLCLL